MLRWLTAGESHGPLLVGVLEGLPAGVRVTSDDLQAALTRRRLGHGRGARMKFEQDEVRFVGGVRHGTTLGGPVALEVGNTEWPKWETVMSADPVDPEVLAAQARNAPLTRPRPGHADLVGMQKYGFDDARPVLERSSARETAARVALGAVAAAFLEQAAGVRLVSHTVGIGPVMVPEDADLPLPTDVDALDADPVRCHHAATSAAMVEEIDDCRRAGDTVGGVVEVLAYGLPPGLGSHVHWDRRLDARLAGALMGVQAIKGVELGDGFRTAARRGSAAHDEIERDERGVLRRRTGRAGGTEGGMTTGDVLRVRAAMKPISTVPRALDTVDVATGEAAVAINQRSDVCAVPAAGVVAEAMVALVLADALLEKFGGDSVAETARNVQGYLAALPDLLRPEAALSPSAASGPRVVLVGPPGAGKTTVALELGRLLGVPVRDTDRDVEEAAGASVTDIFVDEGEPAFRERERVAVLEALLRHDGVLAVGGGAVMDPLVEDALRGHRVAFLDVGVADAARRIGFNRDRPVLIGNPRAQWLRLMENRRPVYERVAGARVDTDGRTPEQVAEQVAALLPGLGSREEDRA